MAVYLLDGFSDVWFSKNPLYRPLHTVPSLSANASCYAVIPLIKGGRKYTLIPCQRDFTVMERAVRLIAAFALTVFSAFFGLFSQSLRRMWGEALYGNGRVDIIYPDQGGEPVTDQIRSGSVIDSEPLPIHPGRIRSPLAELPPVPSGPKKAQRLG